MGTTAEKLAYLKETKNQIKQALETPSNVMRDYANWIKKYVDNQPTQVVTDGVCTNALDVPLVSLGVDGNSYQGENPSPDNPQDIEVIDGCNIWNKPSSYTTQTGNEYVQRDTAIKFPKGTYILSLDCTTNSKLLFSFKNSSGISQDIYLENTYEKEITFNDDKEKVAIYIYGTNATTISNIMLTKGTTPKPYLPHGCIGLEHTNEDGSKSEIIPINLNGNSIAKVGDVKDLLKIYRNGDVEIEKKIGKVVLDGSENLEKRYTSITQGIAQYIMLLDHNDTVGISTHFKTIGGNTVYYGVGINYNKSKIQIYINVPEEITPNYTNEEFQQFLKDQYNAGTPVYVDYQLAEPQTIKLTSIEPITLWQGTNIFKLITNLDTTFEVEYVVNKDYLETQNLLNIVEGENI